METLKKEIAYFKCIKCKRSFGTNNWSWWAPWDDDRVCQEKCPFCGGHGYMESDVIKAEKDLAKFHHKNQLRALGKPFGHIRILWQKMLGLYFGKK